MTFFPAGRVEEVLAGLGPAADQVHEFMRTSHAAFGNLGASYIGLGVIAGRVVLLAGPNSDEITDTLKMLDASDAEVLKLDTLH